MDSEKIAKGAAVGLWLSVSAWTAALRADEWPQWRGPTRDGVWREAGIVSKFAGPELTLRWRAPVDAIVRAVWVKLRAQG